MKYTDTQVVFSEVPNEITLAINISNCPFECKGCHSTYLREDIGEELNESVLTNLIKENQGITCISFMGGDADPSSIQRMAEAVRKYNPNIKIAWYSGREKVPDGIDLRYFNFIKLGPYDQNRGGLSSPTTNQAFYRVGRDLALEDITKEFQHENKD